MAEATAPLNSELAKERDNAKAQQSAEDQKQISDAQDGERKAVAAKGNGQHDLEAANQRLEALQSQVTKAGWALKACHPLR